MKKLFAAALVLLMLLSLVVGCSAPAPQNDVSEDPVQSSQAPAPTPQDPAPTPQAETFTFTDSAGRQVELPTSITRVAPSGSLAQMVLYTLVPERIVGLSSALGDLEASYFPADFAALPVVGQFYGKSNTANIEALISCQPQVIIDMGNVKGTVTEDMDGVMTQTGIPTVFIEADLYTFADTYRTLGKLLGCEERAEKLAKYCEDTLAQCSEISATIPEEERLSVMFGTGESGLDVNAKGSFHAETIDIVGAVNAIEVAELSQKGGGNTISMEEALNADPDVIIFEFGGAYATIADDPLWQGLTAVQEGRYYEIPNGPYNWLSRPPSVNRVLGLKFLAQLLYPQYYNYDIIKEAQEFYSLFWHYDISGDQVKALLANSLYRQ